MKTSYMLTLHPDGFATADRIQRAGARMGIHVPFSGTVRFALQVLRHTKLPAARAAIKVAYVPLGRPRRDEDRDYSWRGRLEQKSCTLDMELLQEASRLQEQMQATSRSQVIRAGYIILSAATMAQLKELLAQFPAVSTTPRRPSRNSAAICAAIREVVDNRALGVRHKIKAVSALLDEGVT